MSQPAPLRRPRTHQLIHRADQETQQSGTLIDLFESSWVSYPSNPALEVDDFTLTYAQLWRRSGELAQILNEAGIGSGCAVGICIPSGTVDLYLAILGVLRSGAAYVPVDFEDPESRRTAVFEAAGVVAVLGEGLDLQLRTKTTLTAVGPGVESDAWIIFTSGTTGTPKGVAVTHRSAHAFVRAEQDLWEVTPTDRVLAGLSVSFDASCEEMWLAWANGAALVPAPRQVVRSGPDLGAWMVQHEVTVASTVPTLASFWGAEVLDTIRLLILGGEVLPQPLADRLSQSCEVWNTYGPTEATVVTTASRVHPGQPVRIGTPLSGWLTEVLDDQGQPVPDGVSGELVIGGIGLARYLDPELDRLRFGPAKALGWTRGYRTGDLVRRTSSGFDFLGRIDDQVKIGGRRLELGEVDHCLSSAAGVGAALATVQKTESGNSILVGYVVAEPGHEIDRDQVRQHVSERLSGGLSPLVVVLDRLPIKTSGKADRAALPWPPPDTGAGQSRNLSGTESVVGEHWITELGPHALEPNSDFFALGGTSVAAARLVSRLRGDYPQLTVSDVYKFRELSSFSDRLDHLTPPSQDEIVEPPQPAEGRRFGGISMTFVAQLLLIITALPWLIDIFVYDNLFHSRGVPHVSWWLIGALWILLASSPGRLVLLLSLRKLLIGRVRPGRYPRHGSVALRVWFLERLTQTLHLERFAGTPWASRVAGWSGLDIARTARLMSIPSITASITIEEGATIESQVDLHGWTVEGTELVLGHIHIGAHARIGTRASIAGGVTVGAGAEVEPGSVVLKDVPAGERWAGAPAKQVGTAGELWATPEEPPRPMSWHRTAFALAMFGRGALPLVSAIVTLVALDLANLFTGFDTARGLMLLAPLFALVYVITHALVLAVTIRAAGRLVKPGLHHESGRVAFGLWLSGGLMDDAMDSLFPIFASSFTRSWLRLAGIRLGKGTECSTASGLNHLVSFGAKSFATDDVCYCVARSREGWIEVQPISVGDRTFIGNSAIVRGGTTIGSEALIGLQAISPYDVPDGTTWLGTPAMELPRVPVSADARLTYDPSLRMRSLRRGFDVVRILLPMTITIMLLSLLYWAVTAVGIAHGVWAMAALTVPLLISCGILACLSTVVLKWLLIGRYRPGEHPFYSTFVWRDEIINSMQEVVAGGWLLTGALGSPIMNFYLRAMGAKVGRDAYVETLAITEYDQVDIGASASINRGGCVETHLFQDRVMQIGPARLGQGASIGSRSAVLLDTEMGESAALGMRSVLLRGESLPARTRWVGAPVVAE